MTMLMPEIREVKLTYSRISEFVMVEVCVGKKFTIEFLEITTSPHVFVVIHLPKKKFFSGISMLLKQDISILTFQ